MARKHRIDRKSDMVSNIYKMTPRNLEQGDGQNRDYRYMRTAKKH